MECSNCRRSYSSGGESKLPLLLQCGCTYCSSCLLQLCRRSTAIKCPECGVLSPIRKEVKLEEQLPVNIYLLGLVRAEELGLHRFGKDSNLVRNVQFKNPSKTSTKASRIDREAVDLRPVCNECRRSPAMVHCQQCAGIFCNACFKVVHMSSRVLREHVYTSVMPGDQAPPTTCSIHHGKELDSMCEKEDILVCALCTRSHAHKGHAHVSISKAATKRRDMLSSVVQNCKLAASEASQSGKVMSRTLQEWQKRMTSDLAVFSQFMMKLHGKLQVREMGVWQHVSDSYTRLLPAAQEARDALEESEYAIETMLKEAESVMQDDWGCVTRYSVLMDRLMETHSFPVKVHIKNNIGVKLKVDQEGALQWARQLCDIQVNDRPNVELLTLAHEPVPDLRWLPPEKALSCSSSASSFQASSMSLPPSIPSSTGSSMRLGPPARSSQSVGEELDTGPSSSSYSTSPLPQASFSSHHRSRSGSPAPQSGRGRSGMSLVLVHVVHVSDPQHVYVRDENQQDQFDRLQHKVNRYCQEQYSPVLGNSLILGLQCAGKALDDDIWYRVILTEITKDSTAVVVQFVDMGRTNVLPVARLSMLSSSLRVCPPVVSRCVLRGIVPITKKSGSGKLATPTKWKDSVTSVIRETLTDKVSMKVYERSCYDVLYVDLFAGPRSASLCDKLVALSLANRTHSKPHLLNDVIPPPMMITVGDSLDVEVIAAQTPWDFYFQDASPYCYEECDNLKAMLEAAYGRGDLHLVGVPLLHMYVAARFSGDNQLYRAKITGIRESGYLDLLFVDYGNIGCVHMDCTFKLTQDIIKIRKQALHGRLHRVRPVGGATVWSEDSSDYFHSQCDGYSLKVLVHEATPPDQTQSPNHDNILTVSLTLQPSGQDIAQLMLDNGKADPETTPTTSLGTTPANYNVTSCSPPKLVPPHSTRTEFAPSSEVLLTPPTPLIPEVPPSSVTADLAPPTSSMLQTRSALSDPATRANSSSSVRLRSKTPCAQKLGNTNTVATTATTIITSSEFFSNTDGDNSSYKDPTWSAEVTTSLASSSQSSHLSLSSLSDQLPVSPPRPVGRAAWKAQLQGTSAERTAEVVEGRAASGRRRIGSAHAIGRSSGPRSPGPRLTGRSVSASPNPPHSAPSSVAPPSPGHCGAVSSPPPTVRSDNLTSQPHNTKSSPMTPPTVTPTTLESSLAVPPGLKSSPTTSLHPVLPKVILPVQVGGAFKCRVVFVESLDRFFLQLVEDSMLVGGVTSVLAGVQEYLDQEQPLCDAREGQLAMAQYEGGSWHRVQVQGPGSISQRHYLVLYVDYGNIDEVAVLKPMPRPLTAFPPQALLCCLHNSVRASVSLDSFCARAAGKTLTAVLKGVRDGVMEVAFKEELPNHFVMAAMY